MFRFDGVNHTDIYCCRKFNRNICDIFPTNARTVITSGERRKKNCDLNGLVDSIDQQINLIHYHIVLTILGIPCVGIDIMDCSRVPPTPMLMTLQHSCILPLLLQTLPSALSYRWSVVGLKRKGPQEICAVSCSAGLVSDSDLINAVPQ